MRFDFACFAICEMTIEDDLDLDLHEVDALTETPSTPEQIAARRAFVERHFANFPDFQQRLAMLDAEAIK